MSPEEKIRNLEFQIGSMERFAQIGLKPERGTILCTYCGAANYEGQPLCCNLMGRAVAAILLRKDLQEKAEKAERIAEKVGQN